MQENKTIFRGFGAQERYLLQNVMKKLILSTLAITGLCLNGYAQGDIAPEMQYEEAVASTDFAVDLFRNLAQTQQGNIVFSPAGLEAVLSILQQGARGETAAELNSLPISQVSLTAMNPQLASALFVADSFKLKPDITADNVYNIPLVTDPTAAAAAINNWAYTYTMGFIPDIVSAQDFSPLTRMVAVNAIYLKEKWIHPFKKSSTVQNVIFTKADGSITTVAMMYEHNDFLYAEGEDWQAVALFYDTMGRVGEPGCFIGILPKGNARDFARTLTPYKYRTIIQALAMSFEQETVVRLPRFELTTGTFSLAPALQACGINDIFTPAANFSGFSDAPLYLNDIIQRCYVKMDEEGTEAAAVTAGVVDVWTCAEETVRYREITFDRPFIWVIGNLNVNSTPYFMGITEEP